MFVIHIVLIMFMTIDAGEYRIIGSKVTFGARDIGMVPGSNWELVIENGLIPGDVGAVVTGIASGGKPSRGMIGICGLFIILAMATVTVGG